MTKKIGEKNTTFFSFWNIRFIWNQSEFNPPGHPSVLQSRELADVPGHALPPYAGLGLLHSRFLPCRPPPQLFEHSLHEPQLPQFPSTTKKNGRKRHHQDQFHLPTILTGQALNIWRVFLLHCTSFDSALTHSTEISHLHKYYKFSGTWNTWKRDNCSNPFSCSVRISLCRIDRCLVLKKKWNESTISWEPIFNDTSI